MKKDRTLSLLPAGYRDAQCGWSLVYDTTADSAERRKISKVGKRQAPSGSTSSKSGKASTSQDLALKKKAQCLCIYAPRRGILEVTRQDRSVFVHVCTCTMD